MAQLLRSEILVRRDSADVRALVESARLTRQHAVARYVVRGGETTLGTLSSTVSGSREEEQLAYVIEGEMHAPIAVRLKGIVLATWDRRPERLVVDLDLAGARHRVDGSLLPDGHAFRLRWLAPGVAPGDAEEWELAEVPLLGPGPLPIPALDLGALSQERSGTETTPDGQSLDWRLGAARAEALTIGGRLRRATRHELDVKGVVVTAWIDESGLPLRFELPGGLVAELAEEGR